MNEVKLQFESETELLEWGEERQKGITAQYILTEFDEYLRHAIKYREVPPTADEVRDGLNTIAVEHDYNIQGD